ncbi:21883_t:CDS:2, partial [Gigaspora rosea]
MSYYNQQIYGRPPSQGPPLPPRQGSQPISTSVRPPQSGGQPYTPPGADPQLYFWFQAVDTDKNGTLTTEELQKALINGDWSPFNIETVRLMMNMFDTGTYLFHYQQTTYWFLKTHVIKMLLKLNGCDEINSKLISQASLFINNKNPHNSGTINYSEFVGLWRYIEDWKR